MSAALIYHLATVDTVHFHFAALGKTEREARSTLLAGWRRHAAEYDADVDLIDDDEIRVEELTVGVAYRDGDKLYDRADRRTRGAT